MGRLQGTGCHIEYDPQAAQYIRKANAKKNPDYAYRACKYVKSGICDHPSHINKGVKCKKPKLCRKYIAKQMIY